MAFIAWDLKNVNLQLKLANYAEAQDSKPRYHVRRISFSITVLENDCGTDEVLDYAKLFSAEDQEVLKWQARQTENLQSAFEVRDTLDKLSGKLCPFKKESLSSSLFGKVTDRDTNQQSIEPHALSSYRHVSYKSMMITKHSVQDGQVQLLYSCDGLPEDRSCLRWRSHDYIDLVLSKARPFYTVFWLEQWDVVDMTDFINDRHVTPDPGIGLRTARSRLLIDSSTSEKRQGGKSREFHGIRCRNDRPNKPWIAEPRLLKGSRKKISLGSYTTELAAALAVDAGRFYYGQDLNKLNFPDSPGFLYEKIPRGLNALQMKEFVVRQAHKMAELADTPEARSYFTNTGKFISCNKLNGNNSGSCSMPPVTNSSFARMPSPDGFTAPSMDSGTEANPEDHVRPFPTFGRDGSSQEQSWLSASNGKISQEYVRLELEPAFATVRNCSSGEAEPVFSDNEEGAIDSWLLFFEEGC